jgi:HSP20 family protein
MADTKNTELQKRQEAQLQRKVEPASEERLFIAPTDIRESNENIVLTADMPGVKPDGVNVTLDDDVLTVIGMVADEHRPSAGATYVEYEVGNYRRSFSLSDKIDRERIEARMNNGVLTLTLPKTRPSQKQIEVKAG